MKKIFAMSLLVAVIALGTGCTSSNEAERVLAANGYTDVQITGYAMFSCSEDDQFKTGFKATAPSGQKVSGAVCSGFLKGATIRL